MDVAGRIQELLKEKRLSQTTLAKALGTTDAFVSNMLHNKCKISLENLFAICEFLNVSLSDFFEPFTDKKSKTPKYLKRFFDACQFLSVNDVNILLPVVMQLTASRKQVANQMNSITSEHDNTAVRHIAGDAAAGPPIFSPADDEDIMKVPEKYGDLERFKLIRARGNSMEPVIHSGDLVVILRNTPPDNGEPALVYLAGLVDDEYTIKRVFKRDGKIVLQSFNDAYPPMIYHPQEVRSCEMVVDILKQR